MNLNYFSLSEFDCPSLDGSGVNMDSQFLTKLESAREIAGIPFKITSGYRTKEYNEDLQNNPLNRAEMFKKTVVNNFDINKMN